MQIFSALSFQNITFYIIVFLIVGILILIWKDYEFLKLAIRNLNRRKIRNMLTVAGIIFSVSLVVGINIASDSLELEVYELVEQITGKTDIVIMREDGRTFDESIMYIVEKIEGVAAVAPRTQRTAVIRGHSGDNWNVTSATVLGIDPIRDRAFGELKDYNTSANIDNLIEKRNSIILSETLIDGIAGEVDNQVVNITYGEEVTISYNNPEKDFRKNTHLILNAYAKAEGKVTAAGTGAGVAFIHIEKARWIFGVRKGYVDKLLVNLSEGAKKDPFIVVDKIKAAIGNEYDVIPVKETALREATSIISGIDMLLEISGLIALAATVFLIANAMIMTVSERTFEIGVLRSIGSTKLQIFRLFLYEICILGVIGSLIGAITGLGMAKFVTWFMNYTASGIGGIDVLEEQTFVIELVINPNRLWEGAELGIFFSLLGGLYPAMSAAMMKVISALKPETSGRSREKLSRKWLILSIIAFGGFGVGIIQITTVQIVASYYSTLLALSLMSLIVGIGICGGLIRKNIAVYIVGIGFTLEGSLMLYFIHELSGGIELFALLLGSLILTAGALRGIAGFFGFSLRFIPGFHTIAGLASKNITRKRMRSALTFGIFTISITMVITLGALSESFKIGITDFVEDSIEMDIIVSSTEGAPPTLAGNLSRIEGVKNVCIFEPSVAAFNFSEKYPEEAIMIIGINSTRYPEVRSTNILYPENGSEHKIYNKLASENFNGCLISDRAAKKLDMVVGPKAPNKTIGIWANGNFSEYVVCGIAHDDFFGYPKDGMWVYIDIEKFYELGFEQKAHIFYIKTYERYANGTLVDQKAIKNEIMKLYGRKYNLEVVTVQSMVEDIYSIMDRVFMFFGVLNGSAIIIALLCITLTMLRTVSERKREIGLLRSVGLSRLDVVSLIILESTILALIGLILGVIDGFVLSISLINMIRWNSGFEIPTLFPTSIVIQTVMIGILIAIIGAAIPAYRASKISPAEAMRYTG